MCEAARPAPYPATTNAKGWRFELDYERIRRSDTWALAPPHLRPWLLMLWMTAWEQVPCGSLPAEDELVIARIGMDPETFASCRRVLMRGWWLADDGRMYHDTLVERVNEMLGVKEKERLRKANYRASHGDPRPPRGHPRDVRDVSRGTDAGLPGESGTGTGTGTGTKEENPPSPRKRGAAAQVWITRLVEMGVEKQHAEDWLKIRAVKRLVPTDTALETLQAEAEKAGLTVAQAVQRSCQEGWGGFKAKWLTEGRDGKPLADDANAWWLSQTGIEGKAMELRLPGPTATTGGGWLAYVASVWLAAGDGPWINERDDLVYPRYVKLRNGS